MLNRFDFISKTIRFHPLQADKPKRKGGKTGADVIAAIKVILI